MMRRNIILSLVLITVLLLAAGFVRAEILLNNFETHSYKTIARQYHGDYFLLVLWSVDCPPCIEELPALAKFHQENPKANLVMVSTDSKNQQEDINSLIEKYGLADVQQCVFDGDSVQAIRFSIDPLWYGELPRSYFHHDKNERQAKSGRLDEDTLSAWITVINNTTAGL